MIKVGVIGLGSMGRNHARVYSEIAGVELVGVADVDCETSLDIASRYHTAAFTDHRELLEKELDAVSVVVPTSLHREVAIDVAQTGVNLLVEKPIADNLEAASDIIDAAERNNVKLMIGHIERFNPVIPILKSGIAETDVSLIEITRIGPFPPRISDVGVVTDLAVHDIDLIRYLTESEIIDIHSLISGNIFGHEDTAVLSFATASGVLARVTVNWLTPYKVRDITIASKQRYLKASLIEQKLTTYSPNGSPNSYIVKETSVPYGEPLRLELEAFINCVQNDIPPPISGEDGFRSLEIAMECLSNSVACKT